MLTWTLHLKVTMAMPNAAHAWNSPCNLPTREILSHISFEDSKVLYVVVDADSMQGLKYYWIAQAVGWVLASNWVWS